MHDRDAGMSVGRDVSRLTCDRCDKPIAPSDVDAKSSLAQCRACGLVFDLTHAPGSRDPELPARPVTRQRTLEQPKTLEVEGGITALASTALMGPAMPYRESARDLERVARQDAWLLVRVVQGRTAFSSLGYAFPFAFMALFFSFAVHMTPRTELRTKIIADTIAILSVAASAYVITAMFKNRVTLLLADGNLRISHGPVPIWPSKQIAASEIVQVWTRKVVHKMPKGPRGETFVDAYDVELRLKSGKTVGVIDQLGHRDEALYIEQLLEQSLGIIDVAVPEETERRD